MDLNYRLTLLILPCLLSVGSALLAASMATTHWLEMKRPYLDLNAGLFAICTESYCVTYSGTDSSRLKISVGFKAIQGLIIAGMVFNVLALSFSLIPFVGSNRKSSWIISCVVGIFCQIAGWLTITGFFCFVGMVETDDYFMTIVDTKFLSSSVKKSKGYSAYLACVSGVLGILAGGAAFLLGWQMKDKSPIQNRPLMNSGMVNSNRIDSIAVLNPPVFYNHESLPSNPPFYDSSQRSSSPGHIYAPNMADDPMYRSNESNEYPLVDDSPGKSFATTAMYLPPAESRHQSVLSNPTSYFDRRESTGQEGASKKPKSKMYIRHVENALGQLAEVEEIDANYFEGY